MSVWVNARFVTQSLTGVQRYALEITRRLPAMCLLTPSAPEEDYAELRERVLIRGFRGYGFPGSGHVWEQFYLPRLLSSDDFLWSPGGSGPLSVSRQVVTIHDTAHLEHPEWYGSAFSRWYRWLLPRLVRRVRAIITVSRFSKGKIVELLGVPSEKVFVTPLGVSDEFMASTEESFRVTLSRYGLSEGSYVLAVSAISERKNLRRLIAAWGMLEYTGLHLVLVGPKDLAFARTGNNIILSSDLQNNSVRYLGRVPNEDLRDLYRGALCFAYPSLYEGFGLPVIEAMALGTPVLTSNLTSLPEVVGDAGLMVDPYDAKAIADGLRRLIEDNALRETLRERGLERVKMFRWERTAEMTWKVLEEAAG